MMCVTACGSFVSMEPPPVFRCEKGLKRSWQSTPESKSLKKRVLSQIQGVRTEANPAMDLKRTRREENIAHIEGSFYIGQLEESKREPETHGEPLMHFVDPACQPLCSNLAEVRENIDALDRKIVALLAERGRYVKDAARFKRNAFQVSAPQRQQEVIDKVTALAEKEGAYPEVVQAAYRALIAGFIAREQVDHQRMVDLTAQPRT